MSSVTSQQSRHPTRTRKQTERHRSLIQPSPDSRRRVSINGNTQLASDQSRNKKRTRAVKIEYSEEKPVPSTSRPKKQHWNSATPTDQSQNKKQTRAVEIEDSEDEPVPSTSCRKKRIWQSTTPGFAGSEVGSPVANKKGKGKGKSCKQPKPSASGSSKPNEVSIFLTPFSHVLQSSYLTHCCKLPVCVQRDLTGGLG